MASYSLRVKSPNSEALLSVEGFVSYEDAVIAAYSTPGLQAVMNDDTGMEVRLSPEAFVIALSLKYEISLDSLSTVSPCATCGWDGSCDIKAGQFPEEFDGCHS